VLVRAPACAAQLTEAAQPAFTHAALSAAFALFTFAEYVRYFALVPFGAAAHVFLAEFLDGKDQGAAVLSHFYLLTACAGPLWLEPPAGCGVLGYTGILAVGVGDAVVRAGGAGAARS
jgi:dolichol kinase